MTSPTPTLTDEQIAKHQPCGCVLCTCEDEEQCHGCGAKFCAVHGQLSATRKALRDLLEIEEERIANGIFKPNAEALRRIKNARAILAANEAAPAAAPEGWKPGPLDAVRTMAASPSVEGVGSEALHEGKLGAHWLSSAMDRVAAGEPEAEVLEDFGYVKGAAPASPSPAGQPIADFCDTHCTWLDHHPDCERAASPAGQSEPVAKPIMSLAEFCAEGERLGLTAADLAPALAARPEFADCLPVAASPAGVQGDGVSRAAQDVLAERRRQITAEDWTPEHDDRHSSGCMAAGAACYALWAASQADNNESWNAYFRGAARRLWPWDGEWWKPKDARRNLIRAAALLLAEIERLDRATSPLPAGRAGAEGGDGKWVGRG